MSRDLASADSESTVVGRGQTDDLEGGMCRLATRTLLATKWRWNDGKIANKMPHHTVDMPQDVVVSLAPNPIDCVIIDGGPLDALPVL